MVGGPARGAAVGFISAERDGYFGLGNFIGFPKITPAA